MFGNAIRDGCGLLDVSDFPNSRDFNAISSEINQRVEERVLPVLKENGTVDGEIEFVGCAEVTDPKTDIRPLRVVPFVLRLP